jgi:hypothetical protein
VSPLRIALQNSSPCSVHHWLSQMTSDGPPVPHPTGIRDVLVRFESVPHGADNPHLVPVPALSGLRRVVHGLVHPDLFLRLGLVRNTDPLNKNRARREPELEPGFWKVVPLILEARLQKSLREGPN